MNILLCTGQRIIRPKRPRLWAAEPSLRDPATHSKAPAGPRVSRKQAKGGHGWPLPPGPQSLGAGPAPSTAASGLWRGAADAALLKRADHLRGAEADVTNRRIPDTDKGVLEVRGKVCGHRHEASGCGLVAEVPPAADATSKPRPEGQEGAGPGQCAENFLGRWGSNCEDLRKDGARYV